VAVVAPAGMLNVAVAAPAAIVTTADVAGLAPAAAIVTVEGNGTPAGLLVVSLTCDGTARAEMSFIEQMPEPPATTFAGVQISEVSAPGINKLIGMEVEVPVSVAVTLAARFEENEPAPAVKVEEKDPFGTERFAGTVRTALSLDNEIDTGAPETGLVRLRLQVIED